MPPESEALTVPAAASMANAMMTLSPPSTPPAGAAMDNEVPAVLFADDPRLFTNEIAARASVGCPAGRRANRLAAVSSMTMMALLTTLVRAELVGARCSDGEEVARLPGRVTHRNRRAPHVAVDLECSRQIIDGPAEFMRAE